MTVFIRVVGSNAGSRAELLGRTGTETDSGMTGQCLYTRECTHLKQMCAENSGGRQKIN